ncbi:MAG: SDR family NAD(P)-dependent oxidoreductase, partial [Methylovulum sp.]|nr:SDR family NAD(P)-dependent oxidoreductase [Methylovulum sp.]
LFASDENSRALLAQWLAKGKLGQLAELWVQGIDVAWSVLYAANPPPRLHLPTYPFAQERYLAEVSVKSGGSAAVLHTLLHENISDLSAQCYRSVFTGTEFFLKDHQLAGEKILPGVVYLEMARAAVALASKQAVTYLHDVIWVQPIRVTEQAETIHIAVFPEDHGHIAFEIYSQVGEKIIHAQGRASAQALGPVPAVDVPAWQARKFPHSYRGEECYAVFQDLGFAYGSSLQALEQVYVANGEVLAKLALPACVAAAQAQFVLHPSLLDAALQAMLGLAMAADQRTAKPALPFALAELAIFKPCTASMWAWVRPAQDHAPEAKVNKLDIDLCDAEGQVCVRLQGFAVRVMDKEAAPVGVLLAQPFWQDAAFVDTQPVTYAQHLVLLCGDVVDISATTFISIRLQALNQGPENVYQDIAQRVFAQIKALFASKPQGKVLMQVLSPEPFIKGLAALLNSVHLENPNFYGQVLLVETDDTASTLLDRIGHNARYPEHSLIRYQQGQSQVIVWQTATRPDTPSSLPWRDGGVYLITGGAGGLGLLFAQEIASKTQAATLVLTGRSELTAAQQAKIDAIRLLGARAEYRPADVSDETSVQALIEACTAQFGGLQGVIHSAGVIKDNYVRNKSAEEFAAVCAPKVAGTVYLDRATRDMPLDFFVLFSSASAVSGNAGQADYAAANAFMDNYAEYRQSLVAAQQRQGQTLAINWPLWQEGGMKVSTATETLLQTAAGLVAMPSSMGLAAFYHGWAAGHSRLLVMVGDVQRLQTLFGQTAQVAAKSAASLVAVVDGGLQEKTVQYLKTVLSTVLKLPIHKIYADEALETYGIDSIMVLQLTNVLEKTLGPLSKTLFFEYQTLAELSAYFVAAYTAQLQAVLADASPANTVPLAKPVIQQAPWFARPSVQQATPISITLDIAIIGLAGRYPESPDLAVYWQNLRAGKDCISEIPKTRWDWHAYYSEGKETARGHQSKWGGFMADVDRFDPLFFNISPHEAQYMDPQERLFLEHAWMAVEDAGYCPKDLETALGDRQASHVGVYAGVMYGEYPLFGADSFVGNLAGIANRVSYLFNLHGPSMTVDTMCSSSLTSVHLACQDLQQGRTHLAIAGGVNVSLHPAKYNMLTGGQFLAKRGRCESFGADGDGYIPGEGVGVLVLKRLADAQRDGDHIYGVIKGSALNHGGKTNGYSTPNPNAQAEVIARAIAEAGIDARAISYLEAHGTGTPLGDPIEVTGLSKAF